MASSVVTNDTTWTTPRTWVSGELVTAVIMNGHVRDNFNALHVPAGGYSLIDQTDYATSSASFTDVDATNLNITFTSGGGDILVYFSGSIANSSGVNSTKNYLNISVDGTDFVADDGIVAMTAITPVIVNASFSVRLYGLSAASHTIKLRYKCSAGTMTLYAGSGSAPDIHPPFYAIEV